MKLRNWLFVLMFLSPIGCRQREYNSSSDTAGVDLKPVTEAKFGFNNDKTCEQYIASNWYVGASIEEEAKTTAVKYGMDFDVVVNFSTQVVAVSKSMVTIRAIVKSNRDDTTTTDVTFDACKDGYRTAIPDTIDGECPLKKIGNETIILNKKTYETQKFASERECKNKLNETFTTIVWRVAELPLWGVIKREAAGTFFPESIGNKLNPVLKSHTGVKR